MIQQMKHLNVDKVLKGYRILKSIDVNEFKMTAVELVHEKTGAKHIHLMRDDRNKTFGVQFKTPPPSSSGVPHILEHTVLCGSNKYPVRDPFFKMLTRSQATYMNALTANDWTLYPFSSLNETDFLNLLSVYLDAVFRPKLTELDFMQEGWRLEPANLLEPHKANFQLKGVVYNEMKGVFSSSMNNLAYAVEQNLLPVTYPHISGGKPADIPALTHAQLVNFHQRLYHPSNSKFFTYGDIDLESILMRIDEEYLQHFSKIDPDTIVGLEPRWTTPKTIEIKCQPDPTVADPKRQSSVAVSFVIDDFKKTYVNFIMGIISNLLLNGDNAPLYQALIESGICQDWAGNLCGFDDSNRTTLFHIGVQGVHDEEVSKVEEIIFEVLQDVFGKGFPRQRIESLIHQIELGLRHDKANFGLRLIMGLSSGVNHDAPLEELLKTLEYVKQIKNDLHEDPQFLQKMLKKYLLDNNHRLTVRMSPLETYDKLKVEEEQCLVKELNSKLSEKDKLEIIEKCKNLSEAQQKQENINCLPCLQISDISKHSEKFPYKMSIEERCQINEYNTNGILYLKMFFNINGIPSDLIPYLPLLSSVFTKMSTPSLHYRQIDQMAESCSGGLNSSLHLTGNLDITEKNNLNAGFLLSSHCLYENLSKMLDLWRDIIHNVEFNDVDRLQTLIKMEATGVWSADSISGYAHSFAMRRAASVLTRAGQLSEIWNGIEQAKLMKSLASMTDSDLQENVIPKLKALKEVIVNKNRLKFAINLEGSAIDNTLSLLDIFQQDLNSLKFENIPLTIDQSFEKNCHIILPYTVNYTSTAIKSVPYKHPNFSKTRVLSALLSSKYLHKQIREIGGAYGGGVVSTPGHFMFYSYRDPQSFNTLKAFENSLDWVLKENISEQFLNEAKLSVFQELDKPISAGSKGLSYFFDEVTDEIKQTERDRLFAVTINDLKNTAEELRNCPDKNSVVIGPEQDLGAGWQKLWFNK